MDTLIALIHGIEIRIVPLDDIGEDYLQQGVVSKKRDGMSAEERAKKMKKKKDKLN